MRNKEKTYFQILAELAPKEFWNIDKKEPYYSDFADIERVRELGSNLYDEIKYFRADLMNKQPQDRITIIEYTIRELLFSYETIRLAMKQLPDPERDTGRSSMLLLSRAITGIISMTEYDLKLKFTDDFVEYWERRQINRLLGELNYSYKGDKSKTDFTEKKTLRQFFDNDNKYNNVIKVLADKGYINQETLIWIDKKNGYKSFAASTIKKLFEFGYLNDEPTNKEILNICRNTFKMKIGIDTVKKADVSPINFLFLKPEYFNLNNTPNTQNTQV